MIYFENKKAQHFCWTFAPPIGESYNFDAMVLYLTVRKTII